MATGQTAWNHLFTLFPTRMHGLDMCYSLYRSSPLRSTFNTGYIKVWTCVTVCTEAVHCVALGTRVTLRFGHVLQFVPTQSIA